MTEPTVLLLAPAAPDAAFGRRVLESAEIPYSPCVDVRALCAGIDDGASAALLAEETLTPENVQFLRASLQHQPIFSDFPFLVVARKGPGPTADALGNLTLLDPAAPPSFAINAVRNALRTRQRQYEYLARFAHQLRNPLGALRNALDAMRLKPDDPEALAWARGLMERQVVQMSGLIDELVEPGKKEARL